MEILMKPKILATSAIAVVMLAAGTLTVAAEKGPSGKPPMDMQGMDGMKMDGGMMEMMSACSRMMQGGSTGHVPAQLPPGNEKLQLQMHAEMLQKLGEIEAKYAAQIKDDKK
jgi:hypothetical protein